jgi:serine/threonine protein kinase
MCLHRALVFQRIAGSEIPMEVTHSDLRIGNKIGSGACSNVFIAHHVVSGQPYAVKMFSVYVEEQARQLLKEISILTNLQEQDRECEALICLKGAFHVEGSIGVVIEYMDQGSVEFMLRERPDEEVFAAVFFQIVWGLAYLHHGNNLVSNDVVFILCCL